MQLTIADLKTAVEAQTTVVTSTKTLLKSLHDQLSDSWARQDLSGLPEMINLLHQNTDALAAAVAENTVAASEPPAVVDVPPAAPAASAPAPVASDAPSA